MGRRNINTTKSGKFMNPTDQARKEARKRELKKNKKQRMLVRAAVLKGKDPSEIFLEMEKIDLMEYNPDQPPPLNDKVLKEKRKKLKETMERVYKLYEKEDPEFFSRMKKMEHEYDKRKVQIIAYRDAVKTAQQVQIMDIPLPMPGDSATPDILPLYTPGPSHYGGYQVPHTFYPSYAPIPIPAAPVQGILKKASSFASEALKLKRPPGVPMGPPPTLQDIWMDEEEGPEPPPPGLAEEQELVAEDNDEKEAEKGEAAPPKKHTTLQQKMLQLAGQDIDVFMRDVEDAQKKQDRHRREDAGGKMPPGVDKEDEDRESEPVKLVGPPMQLRPPGPPPGLPPPLMGRPLMPPRPGMHPPPPPMRMPMRMGGMPMPPGPPPGMPMRMMRPMMPPGFIPNEMAHMMQQQHQQNMGQPMPHNVLTAAPRIIKRSREQPDQKAGSATIEGKPQIRSLAAEVTRFVPAQLRHRKDQPKFGKEPVQPAPKPEVVQPKPAPVPQPTKEDAYHQFMKEMTGLL